MTLQIVPRGRDAVAQMMQPWSDRPVCCTMHGCWRPLVDCSVTAVCNHRLPITFQRRALMAGKQITGLMLCVLTVAHFWSSRRSVVMCWLLSSGKPTLAVLIQNATDRNSLRKLLPCRIQERKTHANARMKVTHSRMHRLCWHLQLHQTGADAGALQFRRGYFHQLCRFKPQKMPQKMPDMC